MVKTLSDAADKWERKVKNKGDKWRANTLKGDYCKYFSEFLGRSVSKICDEWKKGVEAVTADQFNRSIPSKEKYKKGFDKIE